MKSRATPAEALCLFGGRVATQDPGHPWAEAVVTDGNRIVFVGDSVTALDAAPRARKVDLGGRLVLPGFIDNHTHFVQGGLHLQGLHLRSCRTPEEFVNAVRVYAQAHRGRWITGGDWDHELWHPPTLPRKEWIDAFTAETPVCVQRFDGHMALANTAALVRAGISSATPDPAGGLIERDPETREPTGIVKDNAMSLVLASVPELSAAELEGAVVRALGEAARQGITSIHDISAPEHVPVYEAFEREGRLTCRIFARLPLSGYRDFVERGVRVGHGSDVLRLGSMKAFADGSLGSGTAWFFDPYDDEPQNSGLAMDILADGRLRAWALGADRNGLQLSVHAIGDRAIHEVLSIFEEIVAVNPPWDRRFRIEHAQHVREQDLRRFADLGVIVSAQPYHAVDDGVWAERRIGSARARRTYAFRSFLDAGVRVCFGSDWTVAPLDALAGIHAAVSRQTLDRKHPGGWIPEQRLSVEQAITAYTLTGAYASFEEKLKGTLEAGKLADLVVLSNDLYSCNPQDIADVRVDMTVWDGRIVWEGS